MLGFSRKKTICGIYEYKGKVNLKKKKRIANRGLACDPNVLEVKARGSEVQGYPLLGSLRPARTVRDPVLKNWLNASKANKSTIHRLEILVSLCRQGTPLWWASGFSLRALK